MNKLFPRFPRALAFLAMAIVAGSCGSGDPVSPGTGANGATLNISSATTNLVSGTTGLTSVEVRAYQPSSATSIDAGNVSVNGANVTHRNDNVSGGIVYSEQWMPSQPSPVVLSNSWNYFTIAGAGDFAAFADSVQAPAEFTITAPAVGTKISKATGGTIEWDNPGPDSVLVEIDDGVGSRLFTKFARDAGHVTLSPLELNAAPYGSELVSITRTTTRVSVHPDGRRAVMAYRRTRTIEVILTS